MTIEEYREILAMAIENEIAAHDFYKSVCEKVKDNSLRSIFAELAEDELKHKIFLEGFVTGAKPFHFAEVTDYEVAKPSKNQSPQST